MKKYIVPVMEVIELKMTSMLCISGNLGGEANEPAHSPEMDDLEDW